MNEAKPSLKIYVCCHKQSNVANASFLYPIQVGVACTKERFSAFLSDQHGENISEKNKRFCEMTAQYWAWKNETADYYGFFHYRRYLFPDIEFPLPYKIANLNPKDDLEHLHFSSLEKIVPCYDLIAPKGEAMGVSVEEHFASAPFHHKKHLDQAKELVKQQQPQYMPAMEAYFSQEISYFANMYIMSKDVFFHYCEWLFPLLEALEQEICFEELNETEQRVIGYVAERLFGVYYTHRKEQLKVLELPRVHFEPDVRVRWGKQVVNFCFPPETRRRFWAKKTFKNR